MATSMLNGILVPILHCVSNVKYRVGLLITLAGDRWQSWTHAIHSEAMKTKMAAAKRSSNIKLCEGNKDSREKVFIIFFSQIIHSFSFICDNWDYFLFYLFFFVILWLDFLVVLSVWTWQHTIQPSNSKQIHNKICK